MSDFYYIRVRGQMHGPYGTEQIQQLVRQGKVSRYHEISDDGNTWKKASEYAEFFPQAATPVQSVEPSIQTNQAAQPASVEQLLNLGNQGGVAGSYASDSVWRVARNNQELQPVQYSELQQMARNGHLSPGDQVWTSGMPQWSTAGEIPGLFAANTGGNAVPSQSTNGAYGQNYGSMNTNASENLANGPGGDLWFTMVRCLNCGQPVLKTTPACPHCGRWVYGEVPKKSPTYVFLGFFLGFLGVHNFYAGRVGCAIGQLILGLLSIILFIVSIVSYVNRDIGANMDEIMNIIMMNFDTINLVIVGIKEPKIWEVIPLATWLYHISIISFMCSQLWSFLEVLIIKQDGQKRPFI